ncbi:MAG: hypothetical protein DA328_00445 [Nitrososphaeraceae archaeon]|nr:hypothetical protein [Nitrososphaeraceae archaeon]
MGHAMPEWIYIGAVIALLVWVGAEAWDAERLLEKAPVEAKTIKVIGQQWFWTFEHEDGTKEVGEVHVKKGIPYKFDLISQDVNHAFNVPDFTMTLDVIPGRLNTIWSTFDVPGIYLIQCREYCGYSHYNMKANLIVEDTTPQEVAALLADNSPQTASVASETAQTTSSEPAIQADALLTILLGSSVQGSPDYDPDVLTVTKGNTIEVKNADTVPHTVTSGTGPQDANSAKQFDTGIINGGESAVLKTDSLTAGDYAYYCMVHPYMTGTLKVQ